MQVDTNVDEADVGRVKVGQAATFTVDSFPGRTFTGEVVQIRKAPLVVQNVVTYDVVVSARNPEQRLLPGMTANVRIVIVQKESVLQIPNAALRFRPAGVEAPERERPARRDGAAAAGEEPRRTRVVVGPDGGRGGPVRSASATAPTPGGKDLKEGQQVVGVAARAPAAAAGRAASEALRCPRPSSRPRTWSRTTTWGPAASTRCERCPSPSSPASSWR
jgi:HlyD family secretion protein